MLGGMQMRATGVGHGLANTWNCAVWIAFLAACAPSVGPSAASDAPERTPFGGTRAGFGEAPGVTAVSQSVGRCQSVPALDRDPVLADFEQDSVFLRPVPERHGTWFMSNDGSPEGKQDPEQMSSARGGYHGSNYALRYKVEGFTEWGGVVGFVLRYTPEDGIKCPFNAAAFEGLAFMARGKGRVRVNVGIPETVPTDQEGRCQKGCWDSHGSYVFLTDEWREHRIPWSAFAQRGWGTVSRLNLAELLSVNFAVLREDQPAELWLDDIRFLTKQSMAAPLAPVESVVAVSGNVPQSASGAPVAPAAESRPK